MEFRVLGVLEVVEDGLPIPLGGAKQRSVLAMLLLNANRSVSVDRLIDGLWGADPPARPAATLQVYISNLRKALEPGRSPRGEPSVLVTQPSGYVLAVDAEQIDVKRFERLLGEAQSALGGADAANALKLVDEALSLWRGPAFMEFAFEDFAQSEAGRLDDLRLVAIEERAEARLALGDHAALVGELEALVGEHPFRERLWGQLMLALYRDDRQAEALRAFGRLRRSLGEELGIEPSASLRSLEEAIVLQRTDLDWTPATSAPVVVVPGTGEASPLSGTVTFLFTDVEGSTRLWDEHPEEMDAALARHDVILNDAIAAHSGRVVKTTGDGVHAVFATAVDAVGSAIDAQLALANEPWPEGTRLRVRMGVHTGEAEYRDGDYYGPALNRAARLAGVAHGGQIVVSKAAQGIVAERLTTGVGLADLGEHRLRDLAKPEHVYQVVHPQLPREFAPLRSLDAFPGNLPLKMSSFVGREREIGRAVDALGGARVVTLTGVGGVGKTRLAIEVAAEVLPEFPDGAWLCELAAVRDPEQVIDAVAGVFRVSAHPGLTVEESLVVYLRDQQLIIVLDNCEHVLRAVARLAVAIESQCAGVRILATSREGLNIAGEQVVVVPSLGLPDDGDTEGGEECEAVRLFVERARALDADFSLDDANRAEVVAICTRLDGMALAIELAAARIPAMNPAELVRRLDRRFRLLSGGSRVAIERQQTLRATIDWSYDLLSAPEQLLLARLSVFVGGCTLEAVEAVCANDAIEVDDVFESLARLVAHHLVVAADLRAETRYRLLDTIRQYGEERLVALGETDAIRAGHADYYATFARTVRNHSYGPEQVEWMARLAREHDNLFAAMAFALDTQDLERAMALLCSLPEQGLQVNDVVIFDSEAVLAIPGAADHPGSAVALLLESFRTSIRGDDSLALELCDHALAVQERLGPVQHWHLGVMAPALRAFANGNLGRPEDAVGHALDSAQKARDLDLPGLAAIQLGMAGGLLAWDDPARGTQLATEGLQLAREARAPHAISWNLTALAQNRAHDDPRAARALLDEAQRLRESLGYENPTELNLGLFAAARLGDWPMVLQTAGRALHHQLRSGTTSVANLAGTLNLVARGLAEDAPEPAAVIQGAVTRLVSRARPAAPPGPVEPPPSGGLVAFVAELRQDATAIIVSALGDARLRELRAEGRNLEPDDVYRYARTHIDNLLAQGH